MQPTPTASRTTSLLQTIRTKTDIPTRGRNFTMPPWTMTMMELRTLSIGAEGPLQILQNRSTQKGAMILIQDPYLEPLPCKTTSASHSMVVPVNGAIQPNPQVAVLTQTETHGAITSMPFLSSPPNGLTLMGTVSGTKSMDSRETYVLLKWVYLMELQA